MKRVVVLFSGAGTNLQNLIETLPDHGVQVVAAITNRPDAAGIEKAQRMNIPVEVIDHTRHDSRETFDTALTDAIAAHAPDLTVLAGFMRILTPVFTDRVRAVNIHPSLLPKFKGARALQRSFESGDTRCGASVHWVSGELDGGDIIAQASFQRLPEMTLEAFENTIHRLEYDLYPRSIAAILKGNC